MSHRISADSRRPEQRALLAAVAVAVTTSVHHVYGAIVYHTPWRYDAVVVSAGAIAVVLAALHMSRSSIRAAVRRAAWWTFWGVNAVVFVLLIGVFEGLYNHALKDILYFGGAPLSAMHAMFPAPGYELPNDWFFELTGVLQVVVSGIAATQLGRLLAHRPRSDAPQLTAARPMTTRFATAARWTIRLTGPVLVAMGIAFWLGRALSLRSAHMVVGLVFDLAFTSLVVLGALAGMRRVVMVGGMALALAIPVFGVIQVHILPGPEHWLVRVAHLLLAVIAMVLADRSARFVTSAGLVSGQDVALTASSAPPRSSPSRHSVGKLEPL